jgi:hypothetical protein
VLVGVLETWAMQPLLLVFHYTCKKDCRANSRRNVFQEDTGPQC